jgi:hypothetical protein
MRLVYLKKKIMRLVYLKIEMILTFIQNMPETCQDFCYCPLNKINKMKQKTPQTKKPHRLFTNNKSYPENILQILRQGKSFLIMK